MSFRKLIEKSYSKFSFYPPTSADKIKKLSDQVGTLPPELVEFLLETDGAQLGDLVVMFGVENHGGYTFQSVREEWKTPDYQKLYPNSMKLLFFADDGMGGFFGYERNLQGTYGAIYYWDHETDELRAITEPGLSGFIRTCESYLE